ncbi:MAG: glycosyl hydrolase family 18 protein [Bacteroidia bacterium]|nr:glycosyl hydrolase family 18 protein [Bacteroidia bacterium]
MYSYRLVAAVGIALAQPYLSIHQIESAKYKPLQHLTERQWDSVNGYTGPVVTFRSGSSCMLKKQVMGYHPYWAGTAFTAYQWNLLSTVVFFSYEVDPATGSYANPSVINTWRTTSLVSTAQANGTQVQLCASLFGGTNLSNFLTNPTARLRCIDSLIHLIAIRNANGINIDFEGLPGAQRSNFTNFMQQLRDTLNRRRPAAKLSVALPAVDWNNAFDVTALSNICDQLFIMGYDYYWSTASTAGPTGLLHVGSIWGSRCNSRSIIDYLAAGAQRSKLILGVPYYGFRYPTSANTFPSSTTGSGVSRTYAQAYSEANTYGWNWDSHSRSRYFMYQSGGQWYQTWWHDSLSLAWTYRTVNMQGIGGVGMWALSYDRPRMELWGALRDHFTDCAVIACQDTLFDMGGTRGNYFNRENWTWTLAPTGASQVQVTFHDFRLEVGYDTLFIYNGPNVSSPLIGSYTGLTSPGTVTGTAGSLTFRFKSDNATNDRGWLATWNCIQTQTPPTTMISNLQAWYGRNFRVAFQDTDDVGIAQRYVCIADYDGSRWSAAGNKGFAYEDFVGSTLPPGWTASSGTWSVANDTLTQTDGTNGNTNLYFPLQQGASTEWLYHWRMRIGGSGTNRRAGLHIFASDPTQTQRGDSYLLWFRVDNQRIEIYRITGNVLPSPQYQQNYPFVANTWYDIKATYAPATGEIRIWINNQLVATWTDPSPLSAGGYVSLRTGNAVVDYDELRVYRSRGTTFTVEVGSSGHARYESPSPSQPVVRILSQVRDAQSLWAPGAVGEARIDLTPPTASLSVSGWKTQDFVQTFTESDALSGVAERFYLPVYRDGAVWRGQANSGFLYETFDMTASSWTANRGTWSSGGGFLSQTDTTHLNTDYYHLVAQGAYHLYRVQARLTNASGNRRWGFHILVSDPIQQQRGDSYLIWLRYDSQDIQIYETIGNTLYVRQTVPFSLLPDTTYLVEVVYDEGYIGVWINGTFLTEWIDDTPLNAGSYISLRTNQAQVVWDFVEVWGGRDNDQVNLTVGAAGQLAAQNSAPSTPGGTLFSRVLDGVGHFSMIVSASVDVDWTPPAAPDSVYDGLGPGDAHLTYDNTQLSAHWTPVSDPHSGLATYEYAIGTAAGLTDVANWTPINLALSHTHIGLSLLDGQTYYFGVRAINQAGLTGPVMWSDGITYVDSTTTSAGVPLGGKEATGLILYPNPTYDKVIIRSSLPVEEVYLMDNQGRILRRMLYNSSGVQLDLSGLPSGLYWVGASGYIPSALIKL